jgi:hypothetical protein
MVFCEKRLVTAPDTKSLFSSLQLPASLPAYLFEFLPSHTYLTSMRRTMLNCQRFFLWPSCARAIAYSRSIFSQLILEGQCDPRSPEKR